MDEKCFETVQIHRENSLPIRVKCGDYYKGDIILCKKCLSMRYVKTLNRIEKWVNRHFQTREFYDGKMNSKSFSLKKVFKNVFSDKSVNLLRILLPKTPKTTLSEAFSGRQMTIPSGVQCITNG